MTATHSRQPVLFLSHGSPMTALGGDALSTVWNELAMKLERPTAIVMISAHWTTRLPIVGGSATPTTIHDFGGFPDALYQIRYPAPGAPALAQRIKQLLSDSDQAAGIDASHGLDHGAWVPLRVLFPAADIPVLQLSVQPERCARHHLALGAALAPLIDENILIIASGHMTHNLREFMSPSTERPSPAARAFRDWTHEQLMTNHTETLLDWLHKAPEPLAAHPTPEHFLPLFVALGAAGIDHHTEWLGGGWIEDSLAADNYRFDTA